MGELRVGDVVKLVGNHVVRMTVNEIRDDIAICLWFDARNRLQREAFDIALLQVVT
jgi:uncharacterized protein YodC (DUF2158 family)